MDIEGVYLNIIKVRNKRRMSTVTKGINIGKEETNFICK